MAKQFKMLHNGSIVLESELGKGTTVILSLPLS
jgi:signal transduction histidine kinase